MYEPHSNGIALKRNFLKEFEMRVVNAFGKYAIVEGLKPVVSPVGSIEALEEAAEDLKGDEKEQALVAIDIYKANNK